MRAPARFGASCAALRIRALRPWRRSWPPARSSRGARSRRTARHPLPRTFWPHSSDSRPRRQSPSTRAHRTVRGARSRRPGRRCQSDRHSAPCGRPRRNRAHPLAARCRTPRAFCAVATVELADPSARESAPIRCSCSPAPARDSLRRGPDQSRSALSQTSGAIRARAIVGRALATSRAPSQCARGCARWGPATCRAGRGRPSYRARPRTSARAETSGRPSLDPRACAAAGRTRDKARSSDAAPDRRGRAGFEAAGGPARPRRPFLSGDRAG